LGNTSEAVRLWERCLAADGKFADALYGLGYIAYLEGDNTKALERFRAAFGVRRDDRRVPLLIAECLARLGKPEEAAALLVEQARNGQATLEGVVLLGQTYLDLKAYGEARSVFEKAVELAPHNREARFGLATAWARLGDAERSRQAMKAFQGLVAERRAESSLRAKGFSDPTKAREIATLVHGQAARVYLAHGNLSKADEAWRKTAALDPKDVASRMELAGLYERAGRNRAALRVCEELCELEPKRADHWLNVAVLNGRLARRDAALAAIEQAIALEPDNPKYREARDTIRGVP
jgi:tetratricopeptide (TPR) repeat protein